MIRFGERLPDRAYRLRPGAYGRLLNAQSEILVVEAATGAFYLPGGGLETGETAEQAVVREFMEEAGLEVRCVREIGTVSQIVHSLDETHGYEKICAFFEVDLARDGRRMPSAYRSRWLGHRDAEAALLEDAHKWAVRRQAT